MSITATAPRVLVVGGSPRAGDSYALALADSVVDAFVAEHPGAEVDRLDAFTDIAPFGARQTDAKMAVIGGAPVPERGHGRVGRRRRRLGAPRGGRSRRARRADLEPRASPGRSSSSSTP